MEKSIIHLSFFFPILIMYSVTTLPSFRSERDKDQTTKAIIQKNIKALRRLTHNNQLWVYEQNPEKSTPADICARSGNAKIMQFLISKGANVHRTDAHGKTPLMYAVEYLNSDCTFKLLAHGANPYKKDKKGHNAFWYARNPALHAKIKKQEAILALLQYAVSSNR